MGGALTIRPVTHGDAAAIAAIYAHYVRTSAVTFEVEPPDRREIEGRISHILPHYPFIGAERDGTLVGYAYAGKLYERAAYRWTVEATVYVAHDRHRQGIGRELYRTLLAALGEQGFEAVVGKITLPNPASVSFHESFGFIRCGVFAKVGFKHGTWHDVGLYQLDLGTRPTTPRETRPFTR
jgi:phosphinothricin acetyltransferase